jgi:hypothetical protein
VEAGVQAPVPDHDDDVPRPPGDRQVSFIVWVLGAIGLALVYVLALALLRPHA